MFLQKPLLFYIENNNAPKIICAEIHQDEGRSHAMGTSVEKLLADQGENYVFPFFWQHGEDEKTLRTYMRVIDEANCHAVCVESRPHPDFCGPKWWADMDVILDEARKRRMKVWILDDSHFPTGFANGAAMSAPDVLRRQSIYTKIFPVTAKKKLRIDLNAVVKSIPTTFLSKVFSATDKDAKHHFTDDRLLGISVKMKGETRLRRLKHPLEKGKAILNIPDGAEKVYVTVLTRNAGYRRSYINMLDRESCKILLDAVYEPHWEHYRADFGTTIAGFFSDEPELGNGVYFKNDFNIGQDYDLPWSREMEALLPKLMGDDWQQKLPLIWDTSAEMERAAANARRLFMDAVTRLAEECFSKQVGGWCEAHGVEYIGHVIEDGNAHAHTANSLGHYFRGLSGQHMAGIDNIGGQVLPFREDAPPEGYHKFLDGRDGEFYHFMLGKLGQSMAAIQPEKQGRCMCEIFGNYGWSEGPRMEKYLADHFMVQGINRFVPHAFSPKTYPDSDCPPHFYAGGHNPQYRAFGSVVSYINRICALISDGKASVDTAVLYHAEAEWAGDFMPDQKVTRALMEHQIDCHVIPLDVFTERERYKTELGPDGLVVNGNYYHTLLIPYAKYIPAELAAAIQELDGTGCAVCFVDERPAEVLAEGELPQQIQAANTVSVGRLSEVVRREILLDPSEKRFRAYHYRNDAGEIYYFVNENDKVYQGTVTIPRAEVCFAYDAWENRIEKQIFENRDGCTFLSLTLRPSESRIVVVRPHAASEAQFADLPLPVTEAMSGYRKQIPFAELWKRSTCKSIEYPAFQQEEEIRSFEDYGNRNRRFSGFLAYESKVDYRAAEPLLTADGKKMNARTILEITDAGEDVEVFVNGTSAGIQVLPPFYYDITALLHEGTNDIRIEVATTLERERGQIRSAAPIGILGEVNLYHVFA